MYNRLPRAAGTGGIYTNDSRTMWFHLLPYIECDNIYKNNVHNAVVSAYLAPSDPYIGVPDGKINFAGNIRLFGYETLGKDVADNAVDAAGMPTGTTLADRLASTMACGLSLPRVPDGTSNVLMLTTRYAECGTVPTSTYYSGSPAGSMLADGDPYLLASGRRRQHRPVRGDSRRKAPTTSRPTAPRRTPSSRWRRSSPSAGPTTPSSAIRSVRGA